MRHVLGWLVCVVSCTCGLHSTGQEKKPEPPAILLGSPLAIAPGNKTKMLLRGLRLDDVKEVRVEGMTEGVKFLTAGKSAPQNAQDAKRLGDSHVEVEITLPADAPTKELLLIATSPAGESASYAVLVMSANELLVEKEANDSFRQAQALEMNQRVAGSIHAAQNVDVYGFVPGADAVLTAEVTAASRGSALDGLLTIFDERGRIIAQNDDRRDTRDPQITWDAKKGIKYFIALQEANDQGGPAYPYLLAVRPQSAR